MPGRDVGTALGLPPAEIGPAVLALAEDQWFDRKSARISPQKLAQALVAFGNAEGGFVVIGVGDGVVEGTDASPAHRNELMQAHVQHADPPVRVRSRLVPCVTDRRCTRPPARPGGRHGGRGARDHPGRRLPAHR